MHVVLYEMEETPSTNLAAKHALPYLDPRALTVVITKKQTAGYGKQGRKWLSTENDLAVSFCFFITDTSIDPARLFRLGTDAVLRLLEQLGIRNATVKWPNDILIQGEKLCGVLSETVPYHNVLGVILGIGINGNSSYQDLDLIDQPATSLQIQLQRPISLATIREKLTEQITKLIQEQLGNLLISNEQKSL